MLFSARSLFLALSLSLFSCAGTAPKQAAAPEPAEDNVMAAVGTVDVVDLEGRAEQVWAANRAVVEAQPGDRPGQWKIMALKKGVSAVNFYASDGKLVRRVVYQVVAGDLLSKLRTLKQLVAGVPGLDLQIIDDKIVIDGNLARHETVVRDMDRLMTVQEAYKDIVLNLVGISPVVYEDARKKMEEEIRKDVRALGVAVRFEGGTYLLVGEVADPAQRARAEAIVETYLPPILGSPSIRDNVLVLGAKKYSIRNLIGVHEPAGAGGRMPASLR
jgi:hypothetical protein